MVDRTGNAIDREVMRDAMLMSLRNRPPNQYGALQGNVAEVLADRGFPVEGGGMFGPPTLRRIDDRRFREVLWSLINTGVLVQGLDSSNAQWPFLSLTEMGEEFVTNSDPDVYDSTGYLNGLVAFRELDDTEKRFLRQAVRAFSAGLPDAAAVMLGAAAEHLLIVMRDQIGSTDTDPTITKKVAQLSDKPALTILNFVTKYVEDRKTSLPYANREQLATTFNGVAQMIRTARNSAGHPDSQAVDHSHCLVLLRIFPQFRRWSYEVIDRMPL